jgi:hypothetical protein
MNMVLQTTVLHSFVGVHWHVRELCCLHFHTSSTRKVDAEWQWTYSKLHNVGTQKTLPFIQYEHMISKILTIYDMKNGVLWDVTPCGSCKNRRFGGNTSQRASDASYG